MSVPLLDLRAQYVTIRDEVVSALMEVVEDQAFILGKPVADLEAGVAGLARAKYAVGCASGTDALLLSYRAVGAGPGSEVVTSPFTFFATAGAIHNVGATPVFVDIDPKTFNIDPAAAAAAITSNTRAIVPVDLFGQVAAVEEVSRIAKGIPVIEDAAQSIGARREINGHWRMAGEVATIGTFSFFPSKNLGGYGDGGAAVTQDEGLFREMMRLRTHGGTQTYRHEVVGYNSRLDALQAAVLMAKLPYLSQWSEKRRANAAYYDEAFEDVPEVTGPHIEPVSESVFNQYTIRVPRRDDLRAHLRAEGIGHSVYYPIPLHLQPCFAHLDYTSGQCPESERAAQEVVSLPIYPELTLEQLEEVASAVRSFFRT
jgi:dTDP-4-amino-4,6-dideoxygalactose transaminase